MILVIIRQTKIDQERNRVEKILSDTIRGSTGVSVDFPGKFQKQVQVFFYSYQGGSERFLGVSGVLEGFTGLLGNFRRI